MGTLAPCSCGGKRAAPILSRCSVVAAQSVHLVPSKPRAKTDPAPYSAQNTILPHTASAVCNQNVLCLFTNYNVEVIFYKYHKKCVHRFLCLFHKNWDIVHI